MQDEDKLQDVDSGVPEDEYEDSDEHQEDEGEPEGDAPEPEDDGEPEGDESQFDEEEKRQKPDKREADPTEPKKRDKAQTRINQINREKYRALHELEQARAKIAQLEEQTKVAVEAGARQYESNVSSRLERARAAQIAAIESGDAEAQANANLELAAAANEYHELNSWKRQYEQVKASQPQQEPDYYAPPPPEHNADILQDWMDDNDWFNPQSQSFDQELSTYINYCANEIDKGLIQQGHRDKIRNSDYFAWIDKLKDDYIHQKRQMQQQNNPTQRRELNMRVDRGRGPAPVRGGNASYGSQRRNDSSDLSAAEREIAALCRVSPEAYRKQKLYDQRENAHKRGGY
jgi:hypothetical protein